MNTFCIYRLFKILSANGRRKSIVIKSLIFYKVKIIEKEQLLITSTFLWCFQSVSDVELSKVYLFKGIGTSQDIFKISHKFIESYRIRISVLRMNMNTIWTQLLLSNYEIWHPFSSHIEYEITSQKYWKLP